MQPEDRIVDYLAGGHYRSRKHIVSHAGVSEDEVDAAIANLKRDGRVVEGWVRFMDSPESEIELFKLAEAAEEEERRRREQS
jgi:cytosine/adenosine deaminase-related metal-dependent hydrolase